jgi:peptide/nickel transport system substrate-binding protein
MKEKIFTTTRRELLQLLVGGAGLSALGIPCAALAQSRRDVLVIGLDTSDAVNFDPATSTAFTAPVVDKLAYDTLVTMTDGDYTTIKPGLATAWERTPDGKGWRFTMRNGAKFNSGNPVTAEDWKWSFDRILNINAQPAIYLANVESTKVVDQNHFDIILKDPTRSILEILISSHFVVYDRKVLELHGGDASPEAKEKDKAAPWLTENSCGTGAYSLTGWERGSSIQFERNPHYWGGMPAFERVIIRHMTDPSVQLLAIQRGSVDVAFNLVPEQIASAKQTEGVRIEPLKSLDLVYFALNVDPEFNKALAVREARQAIGWALDYDGIRNSLLAGNAMHPATILPIGTLGSTPEVAAEIGFHEDLDKAKALLEKAGFPNGFSFKLSYGNALFAGVSYPVLAQKIQADLSRIGIMVELDPLDLATLRTQYYKGRSPAVIVNWGVVGVDNWVWAEATVGRVAKRMHYDPPADLAELVEQAAIETDRQKKIALWIEYQKRMVDIAYLLPLFQPIYQIPVREEIKKLPLTAAGWLADFSAAG